MLRIGLCCQKGGSGKSTTAALFAMVIGSVGRKVGVYDGDVAQRTLSRALPFLILGDYVEEYQPGADYDFVIYDAPGSMELPEFGEIVEVVDVIVVTTSPTSPDLVSAKQTVEHLRGIRPDAIVALLFVMTSKHDKPVTLDRAAQAMGVPRLKGTIPTRREFERLLERPLKLTPADRENIAGVLKEIIELLPS